jgi:hypothetical protein
VEEVRGAVGAESAQNDQEQLPPKLALMSHTLALAATPKPPPVSSHSTGAGSPVLGAEAAAAISISALARLVVDLAAKAA